MLQIIQGSIILIFLIYLNENSLKETIESIIKPEINATILLLLFFCISFIIGVIIDFTADNLEGLLIKIGFMKPPSYHLLKKGNRWGIVLAHHRKILENLCNTAVENSEYKHFKNSHDKNKNNISNYIFQVAKNHAFRECSDYQKEQLESFFTLYIFSRNLSLSFLIIIFLLVFCPVPNFQWILFFVLLFLFLVAILSSYRYFIYYARLILGSTIKSVETKVLTKVILTKPHNYPPLTKQKPPHK